MKCPKCGTGTLKAYRDERILHEFDVDNEGNILENTLLYVNVDDNEYYSMCSNPGCKAEFNVDDDDMKVFLE